MNKKIMLSIICSFTLLTGLLVLFSFYNTKEEVNINKLETTIIFSNDELVIA